MLKNLVDYCEHCGVHMQHYMHALMRDKIDVNIGVYKLIID